MKETLITALAGLLSAGTTWIFARRKNLAETQGNELDNVSKAVKYYQDMLDDMGKRQEKLLAELDQIKDDYKLLQQNFDALMAENHKLIDELKKYKQLNGKSITANP